MIERNVQTVLIYIVEDDEIIASLLAKALERQEYRVVLTKDFTSVYQEVQALEPDLILLDINLPYHNGYYWCGQIHILFRRSDGSDDSSANGSG